MLKRAIAALGTLAGLVLVIVGAMGFVLLGPSGTWHTEVDVPAGRTAVVIEPALASVLGPRIRIDAKTVGAPRRLFAGWARPDDAEALLRDTSQLRLTGLQGARDLEVTSTDGSQLLPAPDALDVWHSQTVGQDRVSLAYRAQPGADAVVIASADGAPLPALSVRLHWIDRSWLWIPATLGVTGLALILLLRRWYRPAAPLTRRSMAASARRRRASAVQSLASSSDALARTGRRAAAKRGRTDRRTAEPPTAELSTAGSSTAEPATAEPATVEPATAELPAVQPVPAGYATTQLPPVDPGATGHPPVPTSDVAAPTTRIGRRRAAKEDQR